ncbi:MAG: hypothetical protein ACKV2Q_01420 [Planctomycetaceae bacterium]
MTSPADDGPIQWMTDLVGNWLDQADWQPRQLLDWLQGYDLPPVGHEDEPFLWLLRGLPQGAERYRTETRFAERVARVLSENPDVNPPGNRPSQLLVNLYLLCAGLSCPDQLAEPLLTIFERQRQGQAEWFDEEVRNALRAALAENQLDSRLQPIWEAMLAGDEAPFLPGNHYDGFAGLVYMPESAATRGQPAIGAIGSALKVMAQHLEHEHDRRPDFRELIARVVATYPGRPSWNLDLLRQADQQHWPGWAVDCLPSLCIWLEDAPNGHARAYLWHYICACIPETYKYEIESELCGGQILQVMMTSDTASIAGRVVPRFENLRLCNPYPSTGATVGVAIAAMTDLELLARNDGDHDGTHAVTKARRRILPNLNAIGEAARKVAETLEDDEREPVFVSYLKAVVKLYPKGCKWNVDLSLLAHEHNWPKWTENCLPL